MTTKHRFKVNKLIRDKVPDILRTKGIVVFEHQMEPEEFFKRLKDKIIEESKEVIAARTKEEHLEELADVLEIIKTLGKHLGFSMLQIEERRLRKLQEKGGFEKRIYNTFIEMDSTNQYITYYRKKPEDYPEVEHE